MRTERRTDGQTDMTKLIVAFRNFGKALKNFRQMEILNTSDKRGI